MGVIHRMTNAGKINLNLIELQAESCLREDDVTRIENHFNRNRRSRIGRPSPPGFDHIAVQM